MTGLCVCVLGVCERSSSAMFPVLLHVCVGVIVSVLPRVQVVSEQDRPCVHVV